jgi:hypothetical protein
MKNIRNCILLCVTTFFLTSSAFGQNETPNLPIDSITAKIVYSEVIHVDSLTKKQELFSRAREWFAKAYKSSTSVIQMEDKESGKIVGKALMQVYYKNRQNGYINYTISIQVKDGRYKYEVTDFYHTGQGSSIPDYGLCEKMINSSDKYFGVSMQKNYNSCLFELDKNIKDLISDLKSAMATKPQNIANDKW